MFLYPFMYVPKTPYLEILSRLEMVGSVTYHEGVFALVICLCLYKYGPRLPHDSNVPLPLPLKPPTERPAVTIVTLRARLAKYLSHEKC